MDMSQGKSSYVPKRLRWKKIDWIITQVLHLLQLSFDYLYDKTMTMKVDKKYRNSLRTQRSKGGQQRLVVNETRISRSGSSNAPRLSAYTTRFDVDANAIGIDNRCSACISHDINDFVGNVTKTNRRIKCFGGETMSNVYSGTIV